ncbi:MAG TPA: AbrB/MazE/SpoVT family DNA-binding domain-containing protein [Candidatus Saccharimonadales bacterium]|nr:AbrB/MazE/SpoVT family DNA-binding domain-containing protein [Candidatus Saccharimonadales bacterium]
MKTAVQKWGNSLAIRIPRAFAKETQLANGTEVDLRLKSGTLIISSRGKTRHHLTDLLDRVRKSNAPAEINWGRPMGKEVW